jgi:hypothetical protein
LDYIITVNLSHGKTLEIKELEKEIKNLLKQPIPFIGQCLRVLLILKQNEKAGVLIPEAIKSQLRCAFKERQLPKF